MDRRIAGLRAILQEQNLDAALLTSFHNVKYFSDFLYCTFGRSYGLLVTPDEVTVISAGIDGGQPFRRAQSATSSVVYTDWHRGGFEHAVQQLLNGKQVRLGVEFDQLSVTAMDRLSSGSGVRKEDLVDISDATMTQRTIK